jgi:hypothetical protein
MVIPLLWHMLATTVADPSIGVLHKSFFVILIKLLVKNA